MKHASPRFRVVVADDEPTARAGVADLASADPELEVAAVCADGLEAVDAIRRLSPDLVLLDVQMPRMDGFEVVRAIGPSRMPLVVFITAFDRFAIQAFEVFALDYILKPFDDERFYASIARAKHTLRTAEAGRIGQRLLDLVEATRSGGDDDATLRDPAAMLESAAPLTRLVVKSAGKVTLLRAEEIDWIEAADYCVRVHSRGKSYMIRDSMTSLETRLDPNRFFRTHRSAIINIDRVHEIHPSFRREHVVVLRDGTRLLLSRSRRSRFEAVLHQRL